MSNPIKIENTKDVIQFDINGKIYNVPLATGLYRDELKKLTDEDAMANFFRKHLGAEVWDNLLTGAQNQIARAWNDESEKVSGVTVGK